MIDKYVHERNAYLLPSQEAVSINADLLFGNFGVADVELKEDSMVNSYAVKLEDPCYNEE